MLGADTGRPRTARALAAGVEGDLADLARSVRREAQQGDWGQDVQALCGWMDDGRSLIHAALTKPVLAGDTWRSLLASDGLRDHPTGAELEWASHELPERCPRILRDLRLLIPSRP